MNDRFCILGRVTAGVVHDLSNYLGVIDLVLDMLDRRTGKANNGDAVATAREATQRALKLTGCLLDYARGGSPAPGPVDLADTVRRVLDLFGRVIPDGVKVEEKLEGSPPSITGVAPEVEQLVLNLVLNACEAMPRGGTLNVAVRETDSSVSLEVTDTGCGLSSPVDGTDPALSPSTKASRPGGGLGLGIVRCVATRHSARLKIFPCPDGGTSVLVAFPKDEAGSTARLKEGLSRACREILVVDDDPDTRELLRDLFAGKGYAVHTAENGRAALEWLEVQRNPPSCIILDLDMPVMNGWEFMKRLHDKAGVPPVVVVSGAANPPEGAIHYFAKPPPVKALLKAVATCCDAG